MAKSCLGRQELAAPLQYDCAEYPALRQREPLPDGLEHRVLLRQQTRQRLVQVLQPYRPSAGGSDVVPRLVGKALDVIGQVAREVDDSVPEVRLRLDAAAPESE